eukprot:gene16350-57019_t
MAPLIRSPQSSLFLLYWYFMEIFLSFMAWWWFYDHLPCFLMEFWVVWKYGWIHILQGISVLLTSFSFSMSLLMVWFIWAWKLAKVLEMNFGSGEREHLNQHAKAGRGSPVVGTAVEELPPHHTHGFRRTEMSTSSPRPPPPLTHLRQAGERLPPRIPLVDQP